MSIHLTFIIIVKQNPYLNDLPRHRLTLVFWGDWSALSKGTVAAAGGSTKLSQMAVCPSGTENTAVMKAFVFFVNTIWRISSIFLITSRSARQVPTCTLLNFPSSYILARMQSVPSLTATRRDFFSSPAWPLYVCTVPRDTTLTFIKVLYGPLLFRVKASWIEDI